MVPLKREKSSPCSTKLIFTRNYNLHWIASRANILCKYIMYFFNFGCGFCGPFSMLFPNAPASCGKKKYEIIFAALYFYCMSWSVSQILKILFQIGDINISIYVQLKSSFFLTKKTAVESETHFSREAIEN